MVMEVPSPQLVGREFVRQYYTLMNEAPDFLHRFYSGSSSFIHSGEENTVQESMPVFGQKEIHKKIKELNFLDCHTKIRQVDSQATIGEGVVVQVTGELSNRGGPMRRFMQTFVLAHQTPKQYYVHNDIFRYQDEVFHDSYESEDEGEKNQITTSDAAVENGRPAETGDAALYEEAVPQEPAAVVVNNIPERMNTPTQLVEEENESSSPIAAPVNVASDILSSTEKLGNEVEHEPVEQPKTEHVASDPEPEPAPASTAADQPVNEPAKFSWANVAAGGGSAAVAVVPPMNSGSNKQVSLPLNVIASQQKEEESVTPPAAAAPSDDQFISQKSRSRASAEPGSGSRPPRHEAGRGGGDRDMRANERYPDNQQIFVGNLPVDIAELTLKRFFQTYGKVIDIRINRGGGGSGKVPFGFVVFDSKEPVKELLMKQRVEMEGHRLNVEEKKARRDRAGSNPRNSRGPKQPQRGMGSRPKDREGSGSRSDKPSATHSKFGRS